MTTEEWRNAPWIDWTCPVCWRVIPIRAVQVTAPSHLDKAEHGCPMSEQSLMAVN